MICFIVTRRPKSYNGWKKSDGKAQAFMQTLIASFAGSHPKHQRLSGDLYGAIYYFYKDDKDHDADNISKPVWDCLNSIVYDDDRQIRLRVAGVFDLNRNDIQQLNLSRIPDPIFNHFIDALDKHDHFFYVECGQLNTQHYKFNLEVDEN